MVRVFAENRVYLGEIFACFETWAERELVVLEDRRLTYAACARQAARLAHHLRGECGVNPGARVAIALPNSPEWMVGFIAISSLGAVPVLVNSRAGNDELNYCLRSTGCVLCLHNRTDLGDLPVAGLDIATIRLIATRDVACDLPKVARMADDDAILMFTSGTTGLPKAAALSHEGVLTALKTIQYSGALIAQQIAKTYGIEYEALLRMRPPPVNLLVFPLFHVSGCHAVFLTCLLQGGTIILLPRWSAEEALSLIATEKVTAFPGVPTMFRDILKAKNRGEYDLSSLTSISVGGQGTPPALAREIHDEFPQAVLGTGYGMTECNGTVTLAVGDAFLNNPESAGAMVATIDAEIRDDEGRVLPTKTVGEIHVRGAALMDRYDNFDEPSFDDAGWFATGDLGYFDDDGFLYIVDRKTDMVIAGGENIYCAEVERTIDLHPLVLECAAFGVPDDRLGEALVAAVVLLPEARLEADELTAHCLNHLAKHKVPKQIYIQSSALPRNASGKVMKRAVRDLYVRKPIYEKG